MIPNPLKKKTIAMLALGSALSIAAIACGTDNGAPAAGGNGAKGADGDSSNPTPPPSATQTGYDSARLALEAKGSVVVNAGQESGGTFNAPLTKILVNGEQVEVYEFTSASAAASAAATVSADGTTITSGDTPPVAIDYLNKPHYFQSNNVIVFYAGSDASVIKLLRATFGEEFAGDTSPVDEGDGPGYETVLEPAPIESVKVVEDPDNPGFFLLQVTSGLPSGCAMFEDATVKQTGELELTLSVVNRVPAPDQQIACTMIYGMVEHTIPLGSGNDNLDVCEVYTVRWENYGKDESLRFQVTAPNVRCAAPEEPIGGGDDPIVTPIISDLDALIFSLRAAGIDAELGGAGDAQLFPGIKSQVVTVGGEQFTVFWFGGGKAAFEAAAGVSSDGFEIIGKDGTVKMVSWISTPHFYLSGNSIVLYVGVNEEVISVLDAAAGQKFAGPDSKPVDQGQTLPPPPVLDTVIVPAPIVKVGEVVVAESFPPQYFVEIVSAQPNGCNQDAGWKVEIEGTSVGVTVSNSEPADLSVVSCIAVYSETTHNVRLGSDEFESGVEYSLTVNGEAHGTFIAQ